MSGYVPWKIVHVALDRALPELTAPAGYRGLQVVFWYDGCALGHADVWAGQLPLPPREVARLAATTIRPVVDQVLLDNGKWLGVANSETDGESYSVAPMLRQVSDFAAPLADVRRHHTQFTSAQRSSISVIVCTRDRPETLRRCLESLAAQVTAPLEVIVVDNAPRDNRTRELVAQFSDVTYVCETTPGLSRARNTGIQHAEGKLIAFTDDDVVADPNWLAWVAASFDDPTVMAMTGLVLAGELEQESQYLFERDWGFNRGYRIIHFDDDFFRDSLDVGVPVWTIGAGANMAFRRQVFDELGVFDELLGAGTSGCSEDSEFWYRMLCAGQSIVYDPRAVVHHFHRADMAQLNRQIYSYMRGHTVALLVQHARFGHAGNWRRAWWVLPRYYAKQLLRRVVRGRRAVSPTLLTEIRGWLSGIRYYYQHRPEKIEAPRVRAFDQLPV